MFDILRGRVKIIKWIRDIIKIVKKEIFVVNFKTIFMFESLVFKYICMFYVSIIFFIIVLGIYIMRDIIILFGEVLIGDVISFKYLI